MADNLLIDLSDGQDAAVVQDANHIAQDDLTIVQDLTGAFLVAGLVVKAVVNDGSTTHSHGISVGFDKVNNTFIMAQKPQMQDTRAYLRITASLNTVKIMDGQGNVITTQTGCKKDISTLFIKSSTGFKREIVHNTQNLLQQSQNQDVVELLCSLSASDLDSDTVLEIFEICRDIWGEKNHLVKMFDLLVSGSDAGDAGIEQESGVVTATPSTDELWEGIDKLYVKPKEPEPVSKEPEEAKPWFSYRADVPLTQSRYKDRAYRKATTSRGPPAQNQENQPPQAPAPSVRQPSIPQQNTTIGNLAQNDYIPFDSVEGQLIEQRRKDNMAAVKASWNAQPSNSGPRRRREREKKFGANPNAIIGGAGGRQGSGNQNTGVNGWNSFARGNGGPGGNVRGRREPEEFTGRWE